MERFWQAFIEPVLEELAPRTVVDVGVVSPPITSRIGFFCHDRGAECVGIDFEQASAPTRIGVGEDGEIQEILSPYSGILHGRGIDCLGRTPLACVYFIDALRPRDVVLDELAFVHRRHQEEGARLPVVFLHQRKWPDAGQERGRGASPDNCVLLALTFLGRHDLAYELHVVPGFDELALLLPVSGVPDGTREAVARHFAFTRAHGEFLVRLEGSRVDLLRDVARYEVQVREHLDRISDLAHESLELRGRNSEFQQACRELGDRVHELTRRLHREGGRERQLADEVQHHVTKRRQLDREVERLRKEAEGLRRSLRKTLDSRIYRLAMLVWRMKRRVCPPGTLRASLLSFLLSGAGSVVRAVRERSGKKGPVPRDGASSGRPSPASPAVAAPSPRAANRIEEIWRLSREWKAREVACVLESFSTLEDLTVIVPVHDAFDDVQRCVRSLLRFTNPRVGILLIDDGSKDPRIREIFERASKWAGVRVLRNNEALGYTRTVNLGIEACQGDVILLNSDTVVTPRWVEKLRIALSTGPRVATVTAISNAAGAFSVPEIGQQNPVPPWMSHDEIGRLVGKASRALYPVAPTGNGFCLYLRREALDQVGIFDAELFPQGYGEENDLCMRLVGKGWRNVVDDTCFIHHRRSASFGPRKHDLMRKGREKVDRAHPHYGGLVRRFVTSPDLRSVGDKVRDFYDLARTGEADGRPRLLFVLHQGSGGTPATTADLLSSVERDFECFVLTSDAKKLLLSVSAGDGTLHPVETWVLSRKWGPTTLESAEFRDIYFNVLVRCQIDLVHVRHLICHTFDLPRVAERLGIPCVLSFHDFYLACPSIHLIDDHDRYCGAVCTEGQGQCRIPSGWLAGIPVLKGGHLERWREEVRSILGSFDGFVTTSRSARDVVVTAYPELEAADFRVIEHGRDFPAPASLAAAPAQGKKARILVPGNLDFHKGSEFLKRLVAIDRSRENLLELHFLGKVGPELEGLGVVHGAYRREDLVAKIAAIRPAASAIFSMWPETYCHTLTESWAVGVPAFVTDIGTLKERMARHGGGWVVSADDVEKAYQTMVAALTDAPGYRRQKSLATLEGIRSVNEMADDYRSLYLGILSRRGLEARRPAPGAPAVPSRTSERRVAVLVPGNIREGKYPGSTWVRVMNQVTHPVARAFARFELLDPEGCLDCIRRERFDGVLVQRTALRTDVALPLLEYCGKSRVPVIYEIDDDLLSATRMPAHAAEYAPFAAAIEALLGSASGLLVSTDELSKLFSEHNDRIHVVKNALAERCWFRGENAWESEGQALPAPPSARAGRQATLVYAGSMTHGADLELILGALQRASDAHGARTQLVGVQREKDDTPLLERIRIPREARQYADFARWLKSVADWDVALCPLADNDLNRRKSSLKYLEYAALGVPGIYSRGFAYDEVVRDGETGLLVENTEASWNEAIRRLLSDEELRRTIRQNAFQDVLDHHLLRDRIHDWLEALEDLLARSPKSPSSGERRDAIEA